MAASTAVAPAPAADRRENPVTVFRSELDRGKEQFAAALPRHIPVDRFVRIVLTAVQKNPALLEASRRTLFSSSVAAAQDGLLPDGREGALVIYGRDVTWMPMISGILKKIRNSGVLKSISAHVVYEKDTFRFTLGDEEAIHHEPYLEGDRGKPKFAYAIAHTTDDGIYREVMTVADIEKVRGVSRAKNNGPWKDWWDEMARKTVLRRLAKRLPMSTDLDDLIRRDDALYDFGDQRGGEQGVRLFRTVANPLADTIEHRPAGEAAAGEQDPDASPRSGEVEGASGDGAGVAPEGAPALETPTTAYDDFPGNNAIAVAEQALRGGRGR